MPKIKSYKIETLKKRYHKEWVLVKLDKVDESTTTPISGSLLAHSKNREEIYKKLMHFTGRVLVMFTEDKLPKGYAIAFHVTL